MLLAHFNTCLELSRGTRPRQQGQDQDQDSNCQDQDQDSENTASRRGSASRLTITDILSVINKCKLCAYTLSIMSVSPYSKHYACRYKIMKKSGRLSQYCILNISTKFIVNYLVSCEDIG